jgi:hypothetical protein
MEYESYELLAKLANQYKLDINKDEDVEKSSHYSKPG